MIQSYARLLGFAKLSGVMALETALNAVPGPVVFACHGPDAAALFQQEQEATFFRGGRKTLAAALLTVQRRLEVACQDGGFLPMDPAAACCPAASLQAMLEPAWHDVAAALATHGRHHQWDIILKWKPEAVVARNRVVIGAAAAGGKVAMAEAVGSALLADRNRREAALLAALRPAVLAFSANGAARADCEIAMTVLVDAHADAAVEAALETLAEDVVDGASIDMRGPLPPLNFAAVRVAEVAAGDIRQAWRRLGLSGGVDLATLHRQWRLLAADAHPDRRPAGDAMTVAELTDAFRLLRPLLPGGKHGAAQTLEALLGRAGHRLMVPGGEAMNVVPERVVLGEAMLEAVS